MENLVVEETINTPLVNFNKDKGVLLLEGKAIPENPGEFFNPLFAWVEEYFGGTPLKHSLLKIKLEYINSGSSKFILEFFRLIKKYYERGNDLKVKWYYEEDDEALRDLGQHYANTVKIPFELIDYY